MLAYNKLSERDAVIGVPSQGVKLMPYQLSVVYDHNYIYLNVYEPMSFGEHENARHELLAKCNEFGIKNAVVNLYDCQLVESTSKIQQFLFSEEWEKIGHDDLCIAVILPEDRPSQDQFYFVIAASKAYGVKMVPFYSEEEATSWLKNQT